MKIVGGVLGAGIGGSLLYYGFNATAISGALATGIAVAGGLILIAGVYYALTEIMDIWGTAEGVVAPVSPGVRRRNREVDRMIDCNPMSGG